jgi:hypothetical protein
MSLSLRTAILVALVGGAFATPAAASLAPGCANPTDTALNQYCDSLPTATGAQPPKAGARGVGTSLSPQVVQRIERGQTTTPAQAKVRRKLLALPAAQNHPKPPAGGGQFGQTQSSGLPLWVILLMVAVALALVGTAAARWRRRRPPPVADNPSV